MDYKKLFIFLIIGMFALNFASAFDWTNQTLAYYKFDETSGNFANSSAGGDYNLSGLYSPVLNVAGKINTATNVSPSGGGALWMNRTAFNMTSITNNPLSINIWFNGTNIGGDDQFLVGKAITTGSYLAELLITPAGLIRARSNRDGGVQEVLGSAISNNTWYMATLVTNQTGIFLFLNGTLINSTANAFTYKNDTRSNFTIGAGSYESAAYWGNFTGTIDEVGVWNRSLTSTDVSELYNSGNGLAYSTAGGVASIALVSPTNASTIADVGANFTVTGTNISSLGATWKNLTYFIWDNSSLHNQTTATLSGDTFSNTLFIDDFSAGNYTWGAIAYYNNSTGNYKVNSSNYSFSVVPIAEVSTTYNSFVLEGSAEQFATNVSIISTERMSTVYFVWNNTLYSVVPVEYITNYWYLPYNLTIPNVNANSNVSFYWSIRLESGLIYNTTSINQTVYNLGLDNCGSNTNQIFNLTMKDETTQLTLNGTTDNTTIRISVSLDSINGQIVNYSTLFNQTNPARVCLNYPVNTSSLLMDATIEYTSSSRFVEFYNIKDYVLTNITQSQNITLYNLKESEGQEYRITYKGLDFVPVNDLIIQVQRKYIDEGVFKTIEIPMSGTNGYTIAHLVTNDVVYNLIFMKDGEVLDTFMDVIATCQNPSFTTCEINLNALVGGTDLFGLINEDDFFSSLSYNTQTKEISSTFGITSGVSGTTQLQVYLLDNFGTTSVCNDTLVAAGGTLSCTVPNGFGNATVQAKVLLNGELRREGFISMNPLPKEQYAGMLIFMAIVMVLFIVGIAIQDNPMIMGAFLILGLFILVALNFVYSTSWIGAGATVLWFVIAVVVIMIKGGKR